MDLATTVSVFDHKIVVKVFCWFTPANSLIVHLITDGNAVRTYMCKDWIPVIRPQSGVNHGQMSRAVFDFIGEISFTIKYKPEQGCM